MKIFIFNHNTPWGIVKHPVKGNVYKNTISFLDKEGNYQEAKKYKFVNKYLIKNDSIDDDKVLEVFDAKYKLDNSPIVKEFDELSFTFKTSLKIQNTTFRTFTRDQLKNVDYCMTKDSEGNIRFWTLNLESINRLEFVFKADMDVFFSYNIQFKPNTRNMINKSHWNRRLKDNNSYKPNWNYNLKPLDIDYAPTKKEYINLDEIDINENITTNKEKLKNWENTKWIIFYIKRETALWEKNIDFKNVGELEGDILDTKIITAEKDEYVLPYTIGIIPLNKIILSTSSLTERNPETFNTIFRGTGIFEKLFSKDINLLSIQVVNSNFLQNEFDVSYNANETTYWEIKDRKKNGFNFPKMSKYLKITPKTTRKRLTLNLKFINREPIYQIEKISNKDWNNDYIFKKPIDLNIDFNSIKEPALYHPSIYQMKIKNYLTNKETLYTLPQFNSWNNIKLYKEYTINPQESMTKYWLQQTGDFYNGNSYIDGKVASIQGWTMPTYQDVKSEYLQNNKNALQTGLKYNDINSGLGIGASALSIIGGSFGKSPLAVGAGLLGLGKSIAGLHQYREQKEAMLADLENKADVVSTGNNWFSGFFGKNIDTYLIKHSITDPQKKSLREQLERFGYNINELHNLKDIINNRYYFNYVEADDVFNTLNMNISQMTKQIINDAFATGITFWHYRNGNWNGVFNYSLDNIETSFLPAKKKK